MLHFCHNFGIETSLLSALGQKLFLLSLWKLCRPAGPLYHPPPIHLLWTSPTAEHPSILWHVPRETLEFLWFSFFQMAAPRLSHVALKVTQIFNTGSTSEICQGLRSWLQTIVKITYRWFHVKSGRKIQKKILL